MSRGVQKLMRRPLGRIANMLSRALIERVDDAPQVQELQVSLLAEEVGEVEHFQTYGLASNPPRGLEALVAFVQGLRSHGVAVAIGDRKFRVKVKTGEVALYDDLGQVVHLTRDGILIKSSLPIAVESDESATIKAATALVDCSDSATVKAPSVLVDSDDVQLGGEGGKKVALDGDSVVAGKVVSSATKVKAV